MATVSAKDRDPHFGNEPLCRPPQVARKRDDESPPRPRRSCWRRAPKTPANLASKLRQPPREPTPVAAQQFAPPLNIHAICVTVEVILDNRISDQTIRLRKIRQHADTPPARPATKPPDQEPQISRANPGHPALVVTKRDQHPSLPAIGAEFWTHHACLPFLAEILLRRTLHPDDDLHSGHASCRNHAHDQ